MLRTLTSATVSNPFSSFASAAFLADESTADESTLDDSMADESMADESMAHGAWHVHMRMLRMHRAHKLENIEISEKKKHVEDLGHDVVRHKIIAASCTI